jgi:hypothetical protein
MSLVLLAAYDPAHSSSAGDYWAWKPKNLPKSMLDSFYYDVFAKNLPRDPAKIGPDDCVGGYAQIGGEWGCWYRFLNGGRDQFNRLGRFVIGCAFVRLEESRKLNFSRILQSTHFKELSGVASKSAPLPAPGCLEFEFDPFPVTTSPALRSRFLESEVVEFTGDEAIRQTGDLVAFVSADVACHCKVSKMKDSISISCSKIALGPTAFSQTAAPPPPRTQQSTKSYSPRQAPRFPSITRGFLGELFRYRVLVWLIILILALLLLLRSVQRERSPNTDMFRWPFVRDGKR